MHCFFFFPLCFCAARSGEYFCRRVTTPTSLFFLLFFFFLSVSLYPSNIKVKSGLLDVCPSSFTHSISLSLHPVFLLMTLFSCDPGKYTFFFHSLRFSMLRA